jgi:hypothetical protein
MLRTAGLTMLVGSDALTLPEVPPPLAVATFAT